MLLSQELKELLLSALGMPEYRNELVDSVDTSTLIANTISENLINTRYVTKDGDDSTGNGSLALPYLTVEAAINSITDASSSKRYCIIVGVGTFLESNSLVFKPWIDIVGQGMFVTTIQRTNASQIPLVLNQSAGGNHILLANFSTIGGFLITRDPTSTSTSNFVDMLQIRMPQSSASRFQYFGSSTYTSGGLPSDNIRLRFCDTNVGSAGASNQNEFKACNFENSGSKLLRSLFNNIGYEGTEVPGMSVIIRGGASHSNTTFESVNGGAQTLSVDMTNSTVFGSITLIGNKVNISTDKPLNEFTFIFSNGATFSQLARQRFLWGIGYFKTDTSNWVNDVIALPPSSEALDDLARERYVQVHGTSSSGYAISAADGVSIKDTTKTASRIFDSTRTITGTGTSMTLSGAPVGFSLGVGTVIEVGAESRTVTAFTSQTVFTINSAFSVDPSAAAVTIKGLNTFIKMSAAPNFIVRQGDTITIDGTTKNILEVVSQTIYRINSAFSVDPNVSASTVTSKIYRAPFRKVYVVGDGGPITISANPQITAGIKDGQEILIIGTSDVNTVEFADGNGLSLTGGFIMGLGDMLKLSWDASASKWVELYRKTVV